MNDEIFVPESWEICRELTKVGSCCRCLLRFCSIRNGHLYEMAEKQLSQLVEKALCEHFDEGSTVYAIPASCCFCFGALQDPPTGSEVKCLPDLIRQEFESSGHTVTSLTFKFHIPLAVSFREAAFMWHLKKRRIAAGTLQSRVHVKDALKRAFTTPFLRTLGIQDSDDSSQAELEVDVRFIAIPADVEAANTIFAGKPTILPHEGAGGVKGKRQPPKSVTQVTVASMQMEVERIQDEKIQTYVAERFSSGQLNDSPAQTEICITRKTFFVKTRYCKFGRNCPQSPWFINFQQVTPLSVWAIIEEKLHQLIKIDAVNIHGSGREDVDVRMLGAGRTIIMELKNSRKSEAEMVDLLPQLEEAINSFTGMNSNGLVTVAPFEIVSKNEYTSLQNESENKVKKYRCIVWTSKPISKRQLKVLEKKREIEIKQLTPLRVLHRRSLSERCKIIHSLKTEWINSRFFQLDVSTSAGTYVKEFVHSDLGRTQPNLGSLLGGIETDILQLDVMEVEEAEMNAEYTNVDLANGVENKDVEWRNKKKQKTV